MLGTQVCLPVHESGTGPTTGTAVGRETRPTAVLQARCRQPCSESCCPAVSHSRSRGRRLLPGPHCCCRCCMAGVAGRWRWRHSRRAAGWGAASRHTPAWYAASQRSTRMLPGSRSCCCRCCCCSGCLPSCPSPSCSCPSPCCSSASVPTWEGGKIKMHVCGCPGAGNPLWESMVS